MVLPKAMTLAADQSTTVQIQWQPNIPPPSTQTATAYIISGGVAKDSLALTGLYPELRVLDGPPQSRFEIYPNPLKGNSIHISVNDAAASLIEVLNVLGQTVLSTEIDLSESDITLPDLSPGMYFVRMTQHGVTQTKRLVIER